MCLGWNALKTKQGEQVMSLGQYNVKYGGTH